MKNYELEINMMEAELKENTEELTLAKDKSRAERRQRTRRAKSRAAQAKSLKKREIAKYGCDEEVREQGKDRHFVAFYPDTNYMRILTERQLPIRVRRKGVK